MDNFLNDFIWRQFGAAIVNRSARRNANPSGP